jgi:hypothetical protein
VTGPSAFADLNPTPAELAALDEAIAEVDTDEILYGTPEDGGDDDPDGPWHDGTGLSLEDYGLTEIDQMLSQQATLDRQRQAEDDADAARRRPLFGDKIERALDRISRGTYLPPPGPADRDSQGRYTGRACGDGLDDFGRCASRYHRAECLEVRRGAAATGSAESVDAWNATLRGNAGAARALLAARGEQDGQGEQPHDHTTLAAMRAQMGITGG